MNRLFSSSCNEELHTSSFYLGFGSTDLTEEISEQGTSWRIRQLEEQTWRNFLNIDKVQTCVENNVDAGQALSTDIGPRLQCLHAHDNKFFVVLKNLLLRGCSTLRKARTRDATCLQLICPLQSS
jgi:hypothetical protein